MKKQIKKSQAKKPAKQVVKKGVKTPKKFLKKKEEDIRDSAGRPTLYCEKIVKKLEECFKKDYMTTESCDVAGISRQTFYTWIDEYPEFNYRMSKAKNHLFGKAKDNIAGAIETGDCDRSEFILKTRQRNRYATKTENELSAPEPLTPEEDAQTDEALKNAGLK